MVGPVESGSAVLEVGDTLALFTDGLTEAMSPGDAHMNGTGPSDDVTLLLIRRLQAQVQPSPTTQGFRSTVEARAM